MVRPVKIIPTIHEMACTGHGNLEPFNRIMLSATQRQRERGQLKTSERGDVMLQCASSSNDFGCLMSPFCTSYHPSMSHGLFLQRLNLRNQNFVLPLVFKIQQCPTLTAATPNALAILEKPAA